MVQVQVAEQGEVERRNDHNSRCDSGNLLCFLSCSVVTRHFKILIGVLGRSVKALTTTRRLHECLDAKTEKTLVAESIAAQTACSDSRLERGLELSQISRLASVDLKDDCVVVLSVPIESCKGPPETQGAQCSCAEKIRQRRNLGFQKHAKRCKTI